MNEARASDAERDEAVDRLRAAAAEGRLTVEELAPRCRARPLRHHARRAGPAHRRPAVARAARRAPESHRTVLSSAEHGGGWRLATGNRFVTILGSTRLDLRHALLPGSEVEIDLRTVLGSVDVTLPEGAAVEVTGGGFVLDRKVRLSGPPPAPGAPLIRVVRTSTTSSALAPRSASEPPLRRRR